MYFKLNFFFQNSFGVNLIKEYSIDLYIKSEWTIPNKQYLTKCINELEIDDNAKQCCNQILEKVLLPYTYKEKTYLAVPWEVNRASLSIEEIHIFNGGK